MQGFFVAGPYDDGDPVTGHYYEIASNDPTRPQVWGYTAALSYRPGETLRIHAMSSAPETRLTIARDGLTPFTVLDTTTPTAFARTPADCSVRGCGWPEVFRHDIPTHWPSGVYTVTLSIDGHSSQGLFVLKPAQPTAKLALILATGTWCAYNDWGGSNHYQGLCGATGGDFAAEVSLHRPWATGFVRWPDDAPRIPHASPLLSRPRYPHMDYARANGISKKYASSGWAAFERPFVLWAEEQGIALDYLTQHDLHADPNLLNGYRRAVIVGHDEYWTWEMRDHLDAWIDQGGQLARLGVYAGWSRCAAHGSGGFTLYRPDHWSMAGTGLGYGDVLGAQSKIFGYEVDGIDYEIRKGLPYPAPDTGLDGDLTIVALSPATTLAHHTGRHDMDYFIGTLDAEEVAQTIYGEVTPETLGLASRGNGCMAEYRRGRGAVFNAASCEWVAGLIARERPVEVVTRNILLGDWR
jgi:hypothetical protein